MLIHGDDISNDVSSIFPCVSMFVYIHARFCFVPIGGNLTAQWMGYHRGIGGEIQVPETWGAYHLTEKSGWGVKSIMVSDLPVYCRNATSVTV